MLKTAEQMFNEAEEWMKRIEREMNSIPNPNNLDDQIQKINENHRRTMEEIEETHKNINNIIDNTNKELDTLLAASDIDMESIKMCLDMSLKQTEDEMKKMVGLL